MSSGSHATTNPSAHGHFDPVAAGPLARGGAILKEAGVRWAGDACYRMGAALAYYAIFSIFPLLLVSVTILGFLLGDDPSNREKVLDALSNVLSEQFRATLDETLASMQSHQTARGVGAIVGIATLLFGASGVFSELETSLNTIWRVTEEPDSAIGTTVRRALREKAISFAAVVGAGAVLLASLVLSTALSAFGNVAERVIPEALLWRAIDTAVSLILATLLLAVVYRVLPRTRVAWRDVLGGAFVAALLFSLLKHALAWYLGHVGSYAAYGAVGAILGLLSWIYLVSLLVFFGAEITRVYAERAGSVAKREAGRTVP
jgi:membrane protein